METILIFYIIGIFLSASLGVFLAILILRDLKAIISRVISAEKAGFVTSTIKLLFIITAFVGGLSFKLFSCAYRYDELLDNPALLSLKVAGQLEGAMRYLLIFLLIFLLLYMAVSILSRNIKRDIKT